MKFSTAKFLWTVEVKGDWWNVLNRARMILAGKVNDRLWAEQMVHQISNSVFQTDVLQQIAELEWIKVTRENRGKLETLSLSIKLILLKLQIFAILDKTDARTLWNIILKEESLNKIQRSGHFFYHIHHWPLLLLSELLDLWLFPQDRNERERLANIFPRSCIEEDYIKWLSFQDSKSETYHWLRDLKEEKKEVEKTWDKREVARINRQIKTIEENIERYLS